MIFFTSDTHFGHDNVLKYCERPFENIDLHDNALIENWNSVVGRSDKVYHLGDLGLCPKARLESVFACLNGEISVLRGNHDRHFPDCVKVLGHYYELKVPDDEMDCEQKIVLCHYAFQVWNKSHFGSWHLHGHSHGTLATPDNMLRYDVGVDGNNFTPVSYEQVKQIMTRKLFKPFLCRGVKGAT